MISIIKSFPDKNYRYILVVQPENLTMKNVMNVLAEVIGGSEMRIKICNKEQIFLMNEKLMTVILLYFPFLIEFCNFLNSSNAYLITWH